MKLKVLQEPQRNTNNILNPQNIKNVILGSTTVWGQSSDLGFTLI